MIYQVDMGATEMSLKELLLTSEVAWGGKGGVLLKEVNVNRKETKDT